MGALEAAYDDRLLDKQREFTALSQLLFMFENPRKAAKVIEDGINQGIVKKEEKTLKAAAQYWHASRELERAKPYYQKAANASKEGELYIFLGQVLFSLDEFSKAESAIRSGIKKGKLKDENILKMDSKESLGFLKWMTRTKSISIHSRTIANRLIEKIEKSLIDNSITF